MTLFNFFNKQQISHRDLIVKLKNISKGYNKVLDGDTFCMICDKWYEVGDHNVNYCDDITNKNSVVFGTVKQDADENFETMTIISNISLSYFLKDVKKIDEAVHKFFRTVESNIINTLYRRFDGKIRGLKLEWSIADEHVESMNGVYYKVKVYV